MTRRTFFFSLLSTAIYLWAFYFVFSLTRISANLILVAQTSALAEQATSVHGAGMNLPVGLNSKIKIIILLRGQPHINRIYRLWCCTRLNRVFSYLYSPDFPY